MDLMSPHNPKECLSLITSSSRCSHYILWSYSYLPPPLTPSFVCLSEFFSLSFSLHLSLFFLSLPLSLPFSFTSSSPSLPPSLSLSTTLHPLLYPLHLVHPNLVTLLHFLQYTPVFPHSPSTSLGCYHSPVLLPVWHIPSTCLGRYHSPIAPMGCYHFQVLPSTPQECYHSPVLPQYTPGALPFPSSPPHSPSTPQSSPASRPSLRSPRRPLPQNGRCFMTSGLVDLTLISPGGNISLVYSVLE